MHRQQPRFPQLASALSERLRRGLHARAHTRQRMRTFFRAFWCPGRARRHVFPQPQNAADAGRGGRDDEQPGAATNSSGPSLVPPLVAVSGATARAHAGGDAGAAAGERPASRGDGTDNELIPQPADRREQKQYTRNQQPLRRGIGHPVTRSKAKKAWDLEPQNCTHPEDELYMQGNRARFWWTCLRCGSRWSRLECKTDVGNSTDRATPAVRTR